MPAVLVTGLSRLRGIAAVTRSLPRDEWTVAGTGYRPYDETEPWGSQLEAPASLLADGVLAAWQEDDLADADAPARIFDAAELARSGR